MTELPVLSLPPITFSKTYNSSALKIQCFLRKKPVKLTPEEWVRQHIIHFLCEYKGYPASNMAVEYSLAYGKKRVRADLVVLGRQMEIVLVVECKAPEVALTQATMDQLSKYNRSLNARLVMISNGMKHYIVAFGSDGMFEFLSDLPEYDQLLSS